MFRPKVKSVYLLAPAIATVAILSACSSQYASEENLIRQFFRASGLRDNQTLANFATVNFEPKSEGTVADFDIVSVTPEQTTPLQIIALSKALADAEAANKEFTERKKTYQDANLEAIDRVLKAESANRKLAGRDAAVQAEWTKWRDETGAEAKKVSAAREALMDARPVAELSLSTQNDTMPEISEMDGNMVSKDVTVTATVRGPDGGASTEKTFVITVQRAIVKAEAGERAGKWIITAIKPA